MVGSLYISDSWFTYEKSGEDGDATNEVWDRLEEEPLYRLSLVTGAADEQREENKGQVETGGENVDDQKIYKKPAVIYYIKMDRHVSLISIREFARTLIRNSNTFIYCRLHKSHPIEKAEF